MDAQDIFQKLTRGAKFQRNKVNNIEIAVPIVTPKLQIKTEVLDVEPELLEHGTSETALTLLGSMTATENGRKAKKRKAIDPEDVEKKKCLVLEEKIRQYRNENHINVVGRHIAEPAKTFEEFKTSDDLKLNLKNCGYTEPTPIQKQAIPILLDGRQLLACAPTGSGKTAAFLIPIIHSLKGPEKQGFRALIICPTRELAKQTQRECIRLSEGRNLRIHVISKIKQALNQYGSNSSQKFDILITTPNRICFLLNQDPPAIVLNNVEWMIIDEADKLFEEGTRSFRDQLTQVLTACTNKTKKVAMFSATYTPTVAKWCVHNMKGLIRLTIGQRNATTDLIEQELKFVGNESGKLLAFRDLIRKGLTPPVLVFVQSKERAQQLFSELIYDGINVDAIHADRTQLQRDNTVKSFREGRIWVLICTELMARGVDFKGVNLVINYDFPPSAIAYVHRVGRAGRAGRKGKAITFFTLEDTINLRSIAHVLRQSGCDVPDYMLKMKRHSKSEKKRAKVSAPKREDIITIPFDERRRVDKALGKNRLIYHKLKKGGDKKMKLVDKKQRTHSNKKSNNDKKNKKQSKLSTKDKTKKMKTKKSKI